MKFLNKAKGVQTLGIDGDETLVTKKYVDDEINEVKLKNITKKYPVIPQFTFAGRDATYNNINAMQWCCPANYPNGLTNPTIHSTEAGTPGGYWNDASGLPLEIGIQSHEDFKLEEIQVRVVSGYGNPSMKVSYHDGNNWILLEIFTAIGDSTVRSYFISSPVKSKWYRVLLENNNWTGLSDLKVFGTLYNVVGPQGEIGPPGVSGSDSPALYEKGTSSPSDTNKLWLDTSN